MSHQESPKARRASPSWVNARRAGLLLVSVLVVGLAPLLATAYLRFSHFRHYSGYCGPHAPDIPAHPCSRDQYMAEFGAGFAGFALLLVQGAAFVFALLLVSLLWKLFAPRAPARGS